MICTLCLVAFLLLLILVYLIWSRNYRYWEGQDLPAVPAKFPFGSFWKAFALEVPLFQVVAEAYDCFNEAPLVGMYGPTQPVLLVKDPGLAKQVLIDNFSEFADPGFEIYPSVDPLLALNPFGTPGSRWKDVRSIHTPVFTNTKVKAAMQEINSSANLLIKHIREEKNGVINVFTATKKFLIDAVCKSAYGIDSKVWDHPDPLISHMVNQGVITSPFEANLSAVCAVLLPWTNLITRFKLISTASHNFMMRIFKAAVPIRRVKRLNRNDALQHLVDVENKRLSEGSKECFRKLPPLPILTRKATRETSLGGVRVPKGMKIIVPAMKLQNDSKYHKNPEGFDPERFSNERKSEVRKGSYSPFGDGPRICVGMNYAKTSMKVALVALLLEFDWTTGPSQENTLEIENNSTFFLVPKNGLVEIKFSPVQ